MENGYIRVVHVKRLLCVSQIVGRNLNGRCHVCQLHSGKPQIVDSPVVHLARARDTKLLGTQSARKDHGPKVLGPHVANNVAFDLGAVLAESADIAVARNLLDVALSITWKMAKAEKNVHYSNGMEKNPPVLHSRSLNSSK